MKLAKPSVTTSKLVLSKETVSNLGIKSGVRAGGMLTQMGNGAGYTAQTCRLCPTI